MKISKKQRTYLSIVVAISLLTFVGIGMKNNSFSVFSNNRKLPIYSVGTDEKKIAISFDASWGADNTEKLLDILDKYNVKTTFFLVGGWVDKYPDKVKEIHKRGHEIGNHSNTHPDMTTLSKEKIVQEIAATDAKIMTITGEKTKLFRFPSGSYNNLAIETVESTNHKCIQWDVESIDTKIKLIKSVLLGDNLIVTHKKNFATNKKKNLYFYKRYKFFFYTILVYNFF